MNAPFLVDNDGNDIAMEEDGDEEEAPQRRNPFVNMEADEDNDEEEETQSQVSYFLILFPFYNFTYKPY